MFEFFIIVLFLCLSIISLLGVFVAAQLVIERFILKCLPVIFEFYGRIRYPNDFKD